MSWDEESENAPHTFQDWHTEPALGDKVISQPEYPEHPWLRRINSLWKFDGWLVQGTAKGTVWAAARQENKRTSQKAVLALLKKEQDARLQEYKLVTSLIDGVPGLGEKGVIRQYLYGLSVGKIAARLDVTNSYVSKTVNKWIKAWGWDKLRVEKVKIILLTYSLAEIYSSYEPKTTNGYSINRNIDSKSLYDAIKSNPKTEAYFSDLKESDGMGLAETCNRCWVYWYSKILVPKKESFTDRQDYLDNLDFE